MKPSLNTSNDTTEHQFEALLKALSLSYLIDYFIQSGIKVTQGYCYSVVELQELLKLQKKFFPFLNYILNVFKEMGVAKITFEKVEFLINAQPLSSATLVNQITLRYPEKKAFITKLSHCINEYDKALTGKIPSIAALYPGGDIHFLDPIVSEMEQLSNLHWFERFLTKLLSLRSKDGFINMMEVGGGMGRLTWPIIKNLTSKNIAYLFTDISRFFILKARETGTKEQIDFIKFAQFDITKTPEEQSFSPTQMDFILAFNVIHATPNLDITLSNLYNLLKPGGTLIIIEYTELPTWAHMLWGLAEGWWYFADHYRQITPLINKRNWKEALTTSGYKKIRFIPKHEKYTCPLPLTAILAQKPPIET